MQFVECGFQVVYFLFVRCLVLGYNVCCTPKNLFFRLYDLVDYNNYALVDCGANLNKKVESA